MGILERIREIEAEINRTQKNKATEYHLGLLKGRLAKLRSQVLEETKKPGGDKGGGGFDVARSGDARVCLIGFPSVGKSTLLNRVTSTESAAASYAFTTLTAIAGRIMYKGTYIQLIDLPGILEGAAEGKGRGRQVIAVARTCDMVLMLMEAEKGEEQRHLLTAELEKVGLRLNKKFPGIYFKERKTGGVKFNTMVPLTRIDETTIRGLLQQYKIFNAEVLFREDCTVDEFIDVIEGNRRYVKCLYVYNKIDMASIEEIDKLARQPSSAVISCEMNLNLTTLVDEIWVHLDLIRIYTKKRGQPPDFGDCIVLPSSSTVESVCNSIHRDLVRQFKYALVWGVSVKHCPQRVGLGHVLEDEDVVMIMKRM